MLSLTFLIQNVKVRGGGGVGGGGGEMENYIYNDMNFIIHALHAELFEFKAKLHYRPV